MHLNQTRINDADGSGTMFDRIAGRYDLLNRIISLGVDQRWRRRAVDLLLQGPSRRFMDLATGTSDLAIQVARRRPAIEVDGVDPSAGMLEIGRGKVAALGLSDRVRLHLGDAQALEFDDDTFDGVIMGFGIRNVPDRALALAEMRRVTRPGGRVVILELAEPRSGAMAPLARFHIHTVVPRIGSLVAGGEEYAYLQASIADFPPPDRFVTLMEEAGLHEVRAESLMFGVATIFVGMA